MIELFSVLSEMLYASTWLALASAFVWGILSIILSPCHMATIPLVVGCLSEGNATSKGRAFVMALLFALGILLSLLIIGFITGLAGNILGDTGGLGGIIVGALLVVFGLMLADILKLPFLEIAVKPAFRKKGRLSIFIMGLVFGVALGPCSFAFMAPLLGIVFAAASESFLFALVLLLMYALGHCLVIVAAGTFAKLVNDFLKWNETSKGLVWVKRICGILVVIAGIYLIIDQVF